MPTVRVIARLPDYPGKLVRELRARGFEVETRVASGLDSQAADLEIRLEHCPPEDLAGMVSGAADHEAVCMLLESDPGTDGVRTLRLFLVANDEQIQAHAYTPLPKSVVELCTALLNKPDHATAASSPAQISLSPVTWTLLRNHATAARAFCVDRAIPRPRTQVSRMGGVLRLRKEKLAGTESGLTEVGGSCSELVPSMFSLSDVYVDNKDADAAAEPVLVPTPRSPSPFRLAAINWRLASALIAAALIVSGTLYVTARHKGSSLTEAVRTEAVVEKVPSIPAETASVENEIPDASPIVKLKPATTRASEDPAAWRTRSGRWEVRQFGDDVTVRRLRESPPLQSSENPKVRVVEN